MTNERLAEIRAYKPDQTAPHCSMVNLVGYMGELLAEVDRLRAELEALRQSQHNGTPSRYEAECISLRAELAEERKASARLWDTVKRCGSGRYGWPCFWLKEVLKKDLGLAGPVS